ncbi:MAG: endonuclease/exonuclease/phosphatase family protein, partial [Gemmatimonadetes bacterium]|nr:endonuclease/exonuclease/phosphatase family protein [Gemmatimonadota bacterium]
VLGDAPPDLPARIAMDRDPDTLRVLTYNVLFNGLFRRQAEFARILHALSPDVLSLQEIRDHSAEDTRALVARMVGGETWHVSEAGFIVSRYPITASGALGGKRSTAWALISVPGADDAQDVLVINPMVPCCDQEEARQEALDELAAWIRDARTQETAVGRFLEPGTPVIVAGDLNLVGHSRQLRTVLEGTIAATDTFGPGRLPDGDGTPLADAAPRHLTTRETYTWRGDDSPFAPGRLDFIIYTDSVLELAKSFVLWTPDLDAETLDRAGLLPGDTMTASDHLPVVADFTFR